MREIKSTELAYVSGGTISWESISNVLGTVISTITKVKEFLDGIFGKKEEAK